MSRRFVPIVVFAIVALTAFSPLAGALPLARGGSSGP